MKKLILATTILATFSAVASAKNGKLDTLYYGGDIITMDEKHPSVEAVGVENGKIVKIGTLKEVKKLADSSTESIDLKGKTLMPGFVDPHVHIMVTAFFQELSLDLSNFTLPYDTLDTIIGKLKDYGDKLPDGAWILGFGVDPSRTAPFMDELTADMLDKVSTTKPIFIVNQSGHIAYTNHKGLEVAGITEKTPNPSGGGQYVKDANGRLTGKLIEPTSYTPFLEKIPHPSKEEILVAVEKVGKRLTQNGVTSVAEMSLGGNLGVDTEYEILEVTTHNGMLPVRVSGYLYNEAFPITNKKYKPMQGDDMFRLVGYKVVADGSTQGLTAGTFEPYIYPENTKNVGQLNYTQEELLKNIKPRFEEGWQIAVHANGDKTVDETLTIFEHLVKTPKDAETRLRIEHFTFPTKEEILRAKKLGVVPGFTIGHVHYWGEAFHDHILGPERADRLDPSAAMVEEGIHFAYHSDSPVSPINPLNYVSEGVTRVWQAEPEKILNPEQRISVAEGLKRITTDAAYQIKAEHKVGSITPGKYADFVVLEANPLKTDPHELGNIKVEETWLNGKLVNKND